MADLSADSVQPQGAAPVGSGGPLVGPYVADAVNIDSVTLNGSAPPITVAGSASITIAVTVKNTASNNWRSTGWLIATTSGALTCVDTTDHNGNGTFTESFTVTGPAAAGTYNLYLTPFMAAACATPGTGASWVPAVTVDTTAPTVSTMNRVTGTPTNAASLQWLVTFSESVTRLVAPIATSR